MGLLNELSFEKELKPNIIVRQEKKMCDNIAIVGISLKGPKAENVEEFWKNISENQDCIGIVPDERKTDIDTYKSYILRGQEEKYSILEGGYLNEIDKFDYQFFNISPNEAKLMDPHQRIMLQVIWNAFVDAGYKTSNLKGKNIGIYIGFRADEPFDYKRLISEIMPEDSSLALAGNINSIISSRIAYLLDLTGPAMGIDTACSSSLTVLHIACNAIKNGDCDGAIVGASSIRFLPINDEKQIGIESISGRVKSFDDNSDGTVFGEGVAAIVMKPLEKAIKDKDNIYAVIKGSAINQDGASIGLTAPNANAQEKVLMKAWDNAKINPRDISFIETHGTGTKLGDSIEIQGISKAFSHYTSDTQFCSLGAVKTNIGHLDCASGLFGLLKTLLCLKNQKLLPLNHFTLPNQNIEFIDSPIYLNNIIQDWEADYPRICGVSSFGLSGTNAHVVLQEYKKEEPVENLRDYFMISAKTEDGLKEYARSFIKFLEQTNSINKSNLGYSMLSRTNIYDYKVGIIYETITELKQKLMKFIQDEIYPEDFIFYSINKRDMESNLKKWNHLDNKDLFFVENFFRNPEKLDEIYDSEHVSKISTPGYPFQKIRCWIEKEENFQISEIELVNSEVENYVPDSYEKNVGEVYSKILGISKLNVHDSIFTLGGDSIIALKIMNAINENNSAQISISDVMTYDSISSLALHIKNLSLTDKVDNEFEKVHIDDIESDQINEYPLSDAQSLIFKSCLDGNLSYNLPQLYRVKGKIDINKFNESINKIIERHDILRSVIKITANGIVQMIKQTMHYSVEKQEFNGKLEDVYLSLVEKFDFENGPLFRVKLVYVNKKLFVFFDIHHIIADGTSLGIFALEIMNAYHNLELPYVSWQYEKYVAYRKKFITTEKYQKQLDFWMKEHEKYKMNLDPYDNTNSIFSYHSKKYSYKCSSKLSTKLADYCQMHKVSIFAYILSTFRVVMHSYTGRNQLVIGLPTSGRTIADVENTIGMFVNTLPFVSHLDENAITTEMVNHTNEKLLKLVDNQDVFINEIESMDFNIDVLLVHQNYYNPDLVFEDMEVEKYDMEEGFSNYDMVFQTWIDEHELVGELEYNTSAFDIDKIEEILKCFEYVLENMLKGQLLISEINDKLFLTSDEFALPEFSF